MVIAYEYTDKEKQYMDTDLTTTRWVDAQYVKSPIKAHQGNPFIEALPSPRTSRACILGYTHGVDMEDVRALPRMERQPYVHALYNLRVMLPFAIRLEQDVHQALLLSYSRRYAVPGTPHNLSAFSPERKDIHYGRLIADDADSAVTGFRLIGMSGCGKSSALKILLSKYPKVIYHTHETGCYIQIPCLTVNCVPNSNFSALYVAIGDAIDKALGNKNSEYATEIDKTRTLGRKAARVKNLIEDFAIGMIIFDEIQLIDFKSTKENSFDSLLNLSNTTRVAIGVVGTEDAYHKMSPNLRITNRLGSLIRADSYCDNREFVYSVIRQLRRYQWFDEPIAFDQSFVDALYECSGGIIGQIIRLYMYMHYAYLRSNANIVVDASFVYRVASEEFGDTTRMIAKTKKQERDLSMRTTRENITERKAMLAEKQKELEVTALLVSDETNETLDKRERLRKCVVTNILNCFPDYDYNKINKTFNHVYKTGMDVSEAELTNMVLEKLQIKPAKRKALVSIDEMRESLPT